MSRIICLSDSSHDNDTTSYRQNNIRSDNPLRQFVKCTNEIFGGIVSSLPFRTIKQISSDLRYSGYSNFRSIFGHRNFSSKIILSKNLLSPKVFSTGGFRRETSVPFFDTYPEAFLSCRDSKLLNPLWILSCEKLGAGADLETDL